MSDSWDVSLQLVDGSSRKFWRARVEGGNLTINYGRIGTNGQTQLKQLGTEDKARAELEKVGKSKRRKGYEDAGDAAPAASAAPAAPALSVVPESSRDTTATLTFSASGRTVEARLQVVEGVLKTEVAERFANEDDATAALDRARKALVDDG
ncbi:MAG: WGR domain-containing protein, partial [Deltaproteobacteria bacterium]|nr:WGR domain-containing protein [Deltaproteobacteria bacterium]